APVLVAAPVFEAAAGAVDFVAVLAGGGVCARSAAPVKASVSRSFISAHFTMVSGMRHLAVIAAFAAAALAQTPRPIGLYATFQTSEGTFTARLFDKETPATVQNFVGLAQGTVAWRDPE